MGEACAVCGDGRGWLADDDGLLYPCEACEPERYRRWTEGAYRPAFDPPNGQPSGEPRQVLDIPRHSRHRV